MVRFSEGTGAVEIKIFGTVQGVGFRPHVYRLAHAWKLRGWVINTTDGVTVHLEGPEADMAGFWEELKAAPPPLAQITSFQIRQVLPQGCASFSIQESLASAERALSIPPDTGTCSECLSEYRDPRDRRHQYAFINCVNCGPRFSIAVRPPYDRQNTSMADFALCEECREEYLDPADRRFHAEPNACPRCGPQAGLTDSGGCPVPGSPIDWLKQGRILAVKGIGGYNLACNAEDPQAVRLLRSRKKRDTKPFALMCRDLATVRRHCLVSPAEESLLISPARPIVLLKRKPECSLTPDIAPGLNSLGIMLPNNPLQLSLFDGSLTTLVMTSANLSGDPLVITEEEAYRELGELADVFLIHNRPIVNRVDDSVVMLFRDREYLVRRARGYVPQYIDLPLDLEPVFAAGGDLKSVFALACGNRAMLSQYFGDLENPRNLEAYQKGIDFFYDFLQIRPVKAAVDLHPGYISARRAEDLGLPVIRVQHHKAHMASCMADNGLREKVLGVVWDGTGYGEDGSIWGGEFFYGDYEGMERVGSFAPFPMPRGDVAQKNPAQMAAMLLRALGMKEGDMERLIPGLAPMLPFLAALERSPSLTVAASSSGRLFDAAAVLCGFTASPTYEGEAAMVLEALADGAIGSGCAAEAYPLQISRPDIYRISWDFLGCLAEDRLRGTPAPVMAARFHYTMGAAVIMLLEKLKKDFPAGKVVFSGGTFQNRLLLNYMAEKVPQIGLEPYFHRRVPPNDGGLALGQAMLARGS